MWHLQPKKWPKRWQKLLRLGGYSALAHGVVLFIFLFVSHSDSVLHLDMHHTMIDTDVPIIVVPWCKNIAPEKRHVQRASKKGAQSKNTAAKIVEKQKEIPSAIAKPVALSKDEKVTTLLAAKPVASSKKVSGKSKKEIECAKKEVKKTSAPESAPQEKKPVLEVVKQEPVKPVVEDKSVLETPSAVASVAQIVDSSLEHLIPEGADNALLVGRDDVAMLEMQDNLQQELCGRWRPPAGLSADLVCEIMIIVDWDGSVKKITVSKSSGMPMYDMSARQSLAHFVAPAWAKGKEIAICFKQ